MGHIAIVNGFIYVYIHQPRWVGGTALYDAWNWRITGQTWCVLVLFPAVWIRRNILNEPWWLKSQQASCLPYGSRVNHGPGCRVMFIYSSVNSWILRHICAEIAKMMDSKYWMNFWLVVWLPFLAFSRSSWVSIIIPIDELHHFSGWGGVPTTHQMNFWWKKSTDLVDLFASFSEDGQPLQDCSVLRCPESYQLLSTLCFLRSGFLENNGELMKNPCCNGRFGAMKFLQGDEHPEMSQQLFERL